MKFYKIRRPSDGKFEGDHEITDDHLSDLLEERDE